MSPLRMRMIEDMTLVGLSPGIDAVTRSTELALPSCMSADRRGGNPWLAAPRPSAASVGAAINAVTRCSPITPAKPLLSQMPHQADQGWLDARTTEVLPTYYFHVTITVPQGLRALLRTNQRDGYALLMKAAADAIIELAHAPVLRRHRRRAGCSPECRR